MLWTRLKFSLWNLKESLKVLFFYYSNWEFAKVDLYFLRSYLLENPYRMSKQFMRERGEEDVDTYGETPLTTMDQIARECALNSKDIVYELGCGRARTCFWLYSFIGCRVYGVEYLPAFVKIGQSIKRHFQIEDVKFLCKNFLDVDLSNASVIYFYGTCSDDALIKKLCHKFQSLSPKTKIITISYPLTSYSPHFKVIKSFPVTFPWGETTAYLQVCHKSLEA